MHGGGVCGLLVSSQSHNSKPDAISFDAISFQWGSMAKVEALVRILRVTAFPRIL